MASEYVRDGRSMLERMQAGEPYIADDPEMARMGHRAMVLCDLYYRVSVADPAAPLSGTVGSNSGDSRSSDDGCSVTADAPAPADPTAILADLLGALGEGSYIKPPLSVDYGSNIRIGARTFINNNLTALDVGPITIGDDCQIGPGVQLLTPTHPIEPGPRRDRWESAQPIVIGDNVWLGGGVIVCPGVTIGDDTVIGAGAVVTRDIPPRSIAVGNPARVIRTVDDDGALLSKPSA
ncbi:MAG: sugar O-acetyltransferase [Cellulomonadaceae bacterium]|nr:sugar O-acetyltransferase [Cellulomonadaceae bacterium]